MKPCFFAASLFLHLVFFALLALESRGDFSVPCAPPLLLSFAAGEESAGDLVNEGAGEKEDRLAGIESDGQKRQPEKPRIKPPQPALQSVETPRANDVGRSLPPKKAQEHAAAPSKKFALRAQKEALPAAGAPSRVLEGSSAEHIAGTGALGTPAGGAEGRGAKRVPFGGSMGPAFKRFVQPVYPAQARRLGLSARIRLLVSLDAGGAIRHIEVLEGKERMFIDSAINALRRSEFWPYSPEGQALPCTTVISVRFKLKN